METEQLRLKHVRLGGADPAVGEAMAAFIRAANEPVEMPAGKISKDMLTDIAQENVGLAFNTKLALLQATSTPESVRDKIADSILDRAHGKPSGDTTQVNVQVNTGQTLSESDYEILELYRQKIVAEIEDKE